MAAISRRVVLAGLGATSVLAACGAPAAGLTLPEQASTGRAGAGGVLRIARPPASKAETVDPASSLSAYEYLGALYNKLVKMDEQGTVVPDLATSWEVTPDAQTWTFHLRRGVTFHNGQPCTATDAAYTIRHRTRRRRRPAPGGSRPAPRPRPCARPRAPRCSRTRARRTRGSRRPAPSLDLARGARHRVGEPVDGLGRRGAEAGDRRAGSQITSQMAIAERVRVRQRAAPGSGRRSRAGAS